MQIIGMYRIIYKKENQTMDCYTFSKVYSRTCTEIVKDNGQ